MTNYNPVDYSPAIPDFPVVNPFLPCYGKFDLTTYIQGASDYEIMANLVQLYNTMAKGYNDVQKLSTDTVTAFNQLQAFINDVFAQPDLNQTLQNVLTNMFENGTMQKYLEPLLGYVTPEMFGAIGDGIADDTDAFQHAVDNGYNISLISNKYKISTVQIKKTVHINCNNADITITEDGFNIQAVPVSIKNANFSINNNCSAISGSPFYSLFENITSNGGQNCFNLNTNYGTGTLVENAFHHITVKNAVEGVKIGESSNNKLTDGLIDDIVLFNAHLSIGSGAGWVVTNLHSYGNTGIAIADCYYTKLSNLYCEGGSPAVALTIQNICEISNCYISYADGNGINAQISGYTNIKYPMLIMSNVTLYSNTPTSADPIKLYEVNASGQPYITANGNMPLTNLSSSKIEYHSSASPDTTSVTVPIPLNSTRALYHLKFECCTTTFSNAGVPERHTTEGFLKYANAQWVFSGVNSTSGVSADVTDAKCTINWSYTGTNQYGTIDLVIE